MTGTQFKEFALAHRDRPWDASAAEIRVRRWAGADKLRTGPRAIMAVGAVIQGGRGGIDLPQKDIARVKSHRAKYYEKMGETPRWKRD